MTKTQDAKFSMYSAVLKHLQSNPALTGTIPALAAGITRLEEKITAIRQTGALQEAKTGGITGEKNSLREVLISEAVTVAGLIHARAVAGEDGITAAGFDITESALDSLKDNKLPEAAARILQKAEEDKAALADYGLEAGDLTSLQEALTAYAGAVNSPRIAIVNRSGLTVSLPALFADTDTLLGSVIDTTLRKLQKKDAAFYEAYKAARRIVDAAGKRKKTAVAVPPVVAEVVGS